MGKRLELISELQRGSGIEPHYLFHPRVWAHEGCIIDLGCSGWDWSGCFLGKKRVIGCDPSESQIPEGAELFKGFVGNFSGRIRYDDGNQNRISGLIKGNTEAEMIPLEELLRRFKIESVSLLKMNIEGMEYDLLIHLKKPVADQMVISFHDYLSSGFNHSRATALILEYLSEWYDWCPISTKTGWHILVKK
jgi:hypothetical protein